MWIYVKHPRLQVLVQLIVLCLTARKLSQSNFLTLAIQIIGSKLPSTLESNLSKTCIKQQGYEKLECYNKYEHWRDEDCKLCPS